MTTIAESRSANLAVPLLSQSSSSLGLSSEGDDDEIKMFPLNATEIHTGEIDSMVAQEMSAMSMKDLEEVYHDVHCVSSEINETPELIQRSLLQLAQELDRIDDKTAFNLAQSINPAYVKNPKFRLQFLRADRMDPTRAAGRLIRHFQAKLELFGVDMLTKDITQDDLDEETLVALYHGSGQTLPVRDRAGRLILVSFVHPTNISIVAKLRRIFYGIMVNVENEEAQRKGCVGVSYLVGNQLNISEIRHRRNWNSKLSVLWTALPIRIDASHYCHDSIAWKTLFAVFKMATTMFTRLRIREYYGTQSECLSHLQSFGIPSHEFPLKEDGTILTEAHVEMWTKRRALERARNQRSHQEDQQQQNIPLENSPTNIHDALDRIDVPGWNDVLLGRGKPCYHHSGNIRLRKIIDIRSQEYDVGGFREKQRITSEVVDMIHRTMGRFLKADGFGWVEVEKTVAKKKVAHAFRTLRSSRKARRDSFRPV